MPEVPTAYLHFVQSRNSLGTSTNQDLKLHDRCQEGTRVTPQSLLICAVRESKLTGQPGSGSPVTAA